MTVCLITSRRITLRISDLPTPVSRISGPPNRLDCSIKTEKPTVFHSTNYSSRTIWTWGPFFRTQKKEQQEYREIGASESSDKSRNCCRERNIVRFVLNATACLWGARWHCDYILPAAPAQQLKYELRVIRRFNSIGRFGSLVGSCRVTSFGKFVWGAHPFTRIRVRLSTPAG